MALTRDQKTAQLDELVQKLSTASSVVFTNYIGLKVSEVSELRKKLREAGAEMKVAKKTLMRLAAEKQNLPTPADDMLTGPVACIFCFTDPVSGASAAMQFGKDHPQISFLGGFFDGKLLTKTDAVSLASIPGRQVLLGIFAGMIRSPLVSFASMCNSPLTGFARALSEIAKKKGVTA